MSGGQFNCPIVFRGPERERAPGRQPALATRWSTSTRTSRASRSSRPRSPADAKGLLKTAIRDDNPVLFMERETLYAHEGRGARRASTSIPLGEAHVVRAGHATCTIVAYSRMTHVALEAATALAKEGIVGRGRRPAKPAPARRGDARRVACTKTHRCVVVARGLALRRRRRRDRRPRAAPRVRRARRADPARRARSTCRCRTTRSSSSCACRSRSASSRRCKRAAWRAERGELMAKILEMPKLSPTMEEGVLSAWHKKEGDAIARRRSPRRGRDRQGDDGVSRVRQGHAAEAPRRRRART